MTKSGNVHLSDSAKVFGTVAGRVTGDVNSTSITAMCSRSKSTLTLAQARARLARLPDPAPLPLRLTCATWLQP